MGDVAKKRGEGNDKGNRKKSPGHWAVFLSKVYERFDATSIAEADDVRLEYFSKKIFPKIKDSIQIRGIKNLIIYSLPERKEFYPEVLNMLEGSENIECTVLFSRFDQLRLERIVGTNASKRMLSSKKDIFIFF
ncbi:hypothetical protein ACLOJK_003774 [Asimina triloba]